MQATLPFQASLLVGLGGGAGAFLRYHAGRMMTGWLGAPAMQAFPFATLAVNTLGSLLMGVLAGWLMRHGASGAPGTDQLRLLFGVGLFGGFTTFSAFSLELVLLIERGQWLLAGAYALLSVGLGITGLLVGTLLVRPAL